MTVNYNEVKFDKQKLNELYVLLW